MKQLALFPVREMPLSGRDPNTFARGLAKCRAALANAKERK